MNAIPFLSKASVRFMGREFGTPVFVYDERTLRRQARLVLGFPNAFGLTVRYAMKACPTSAVLEVLAGAGLHVDASSGYEVERALHAGVSPERIQLTAQEVPDNLAALVERGVLFNACSVAQIHAFGRRFPGGSFRYGSIPVWAPGTTTGRTSAGRRPVSAFGMSIWTRRWRPGGSTGSSSPVCTRTLDRGATRRCGSAWR